METLEQIESLLKQRDFAEESLRYAAPEEAPWFARRVKRIMREVLVLMDLVEWVEPVHDLKSEI
jgi:hypothetical protein